MSGRDEKKSGTLEERERVDIYRFIPGGVNIINILLNLIMYIKNDERQNLRDLRDDLQILDTEDRFRSNEYLMLSRIIRLALEE